MAMLTSGAVAADKKTYSYMCKGGGFNVTAVVESFGGVDRWSKSEPVILHIGAEPPQTLIADPDAPDADSYKNKDATIDLKGVKSIDHVTVTTEPGRGSYALYGTTGR